jgi:hypothetical protein
MTKRVRPPATSLLAAKIDAWRLDRQRLGAAATARRPEEVAETLIGVQAQILSAAALSIALRSRDGKVAATTKALADRRLVRSWAMRGTLHLFSADDFPVIAAALRHREPWRSAAWLRFFKVTEAQVEAVIEAVGEILDDGQPKTRADLAVALRARLGPEIGAHMSSSWGTFLKPVASRGLLMQASTDGPNVAYVRPDRWLAAWRVVDPDEALRDLIRRYLAAYGPASMAEILRWWGAQRTTSIRAAINDFGDALTEVDVDGHRGYLLATDVSAVEATRPIGDGVVLLGPFDPLIVGAGSRDRLIPAEHLKRVSRTAGWISPVVLVGGRTAGVWTSTREGDRLKVTIDPFVRPSAALRRAIESAAEWVAAAQAAEAHVTFGPVFAAPTTARNED